MAAAVEVCAPCANMVPKFHRYLGCKLNDVQVVKQKPCFANQALKVRWTASTSRLSLERITPGYRRRESTCVVVRALAGDDEEQEAGTEIGCSEDPAYCSEEVCPWPPTSGATSVANALQAANTAYTKVGEKGSSSVLVPDVSLTTGTGSTPQTLSPDLSQSSMADAVGSGSEAPTAETVKPVENILGAKQKGITIAFKTTAPNLPSQLPKVRVNGGLDKDGLVYSENFVIRCYEVGMNKTATIEAIASLLQECACNHAQSVGFSTDGFATTPAMRKRHLIWITTRMHIVMDEYPVWGQAIQVDTWYQGEARMRTRRDWLVKDENGCVIGRASSIWLMLNSHTRRPSKIPDDARAEYMAFVPIPPRWAIAEEDLKLVKNLPTTEKYEYSKSPLLVKNNDLDMNQHVNNVTFIEWMLESVPQDITNSHEVHSIILDYKRECQRDDVVESLSSPVEDLVYYGQPKQFATSSEGNAGAEGQLPSPQAAADSQPKVYVHLLRLITGAVINSGMTTWKKLKAKGNAEPGAEPTSRRQS